MVLYRIGCEADNALVSQCSYIPVISTGSCQARALFQFAFQRGCTSVFVFPQMRDSDPDFRIVATDDLMKGLSDNTLKLAESDEGQVTQAVMRLLADTNGEVQNRAVQWYVSVCLQFALARWLDRFALVQKWG